jgi:5-methylcytosine-specific restriction endonuclease McrA
MPIRKTERNRYPSNWKIISMYVRFVRADNRCEWCRAENYKPHPLTGSKVVLTVAHLDHTPENVSLTNLAALCQKCHNNYDRQHRNETMKAKRIVNDTTTVIP